MDFLFSLIIIGFVDYVAISIFWLRHKSQILSHSSASISEDLSILKRRKKAKKVSDDEKEDDA